MNFIQEPQYWLTWINKKSNFNCRENESLLNIDVEDFSLLLRSLLHLQIYERRLTHELIRKYLNVILIVEKMKVY